MKSIQRDRDGIAADWKRVYPSSVPAWIVSADLKFNLALYSPLWRFAFYCVAYGSAYLIFRFWFEPLNRSIRQS